MRGGLIASRNQTNGQGRPFALPPLRPYPEAAGPDWGALRAVFARREQASSMAFDRESLRRYDADGRLHVALLPITEATVNEYAGREIPGANELGLEPDRVYPLFRDPGELRKAVSTFNNLPLLSRHVPVDATNYAPEFVIGSTGTDAIFDDPFLKNTLVVWAKPAIDEIKSGAKKSLSAAYRYVPILESGTYKGQPFEIRMTRIIANHLALVFSPRVDGIVIGDAARPVNWAPWRPFSPGARKGRRAAIAIDEDRVRVAWHEAGHTIAARLSGRDASVRLGVVRGSDGRMSFKGVTHERCPAREVDRGRPRLHRGNGRPRRG